MERWLVWGVVLWLGACNHRSEQAIRAEFDAYVAQRNSCQATEDCVLAATGCPLGCGAAVNVKHQGAVESKAAELIDEYESAGRGCEYDCRASTVECVAGHCESVPH